MMFTQLSPRFLSLFIFVFGLATALDKDLTITYSNTSYPGLLGSTASFVCSWSFVPPEEAATGITFSSDINTIYTYSIGNVLGLPPAKDSGFDSTRMSVQNEGVNTGNVQLTVSNLQCTDQGTYRCVYSIVLDGNVVDPSPEEVQTVVIKVPPEAPTLSPSVDLSVGVLEGDTVVLTCVANVGTNNKGRISWRIYRVDVPEDISASDSRVNSVRTDNSNCVDTYSSALTLQLNRQDQNLVATCFVSNDDFPETLNLPVACENQLLCDQTERVYIHYPVSADTITVTHDPQDVYHGGSVTLSCMADGFPAPTIVWMKGNETMDGESGGLGVSRLVLSNLTVDGDSGLYTCVASNNVRGSLTTVNKTINITVSPTSPPPTEPPTTPTTTTTPGDQNTAKSTGGGGGDDTVIIIVVVIVVLVVVIVVVAGIILYKKRMAKKDVEQPPAKPGNNANFNHAFVQPDLVADEKIRTPSLNNSFDVKNEDGLMYADLTYDNRPRSRKPLALGDNASDYSDIQMPHV